MRINDTKSIIEAQNGDKEQLAKLVEENNGLIWSIIKRFTGRGYEIDDIYQIGCMGFIKAIRRFDVNFEVKLSTYAVPYILGEIKRFLRDDGPVKVSRSLKELNIKISQVQKEYLIREGQEITIDQIAKILKLPKEEIAMAMEAGKPVESIESSTYTDKDDKTINIIDKISSNKDEANLITNKIVLNEMINKLDTREKEIIMLRFYKDKTQSEVAKILGISQVQVSRLERKILQNMKEQLIS